jgi:hypothetical protein
VTEQATTAGGTETDGFAEAEESRIHGLDELAGRLDRIEQIVRRLVPGSREDSRERVERRLDRPSTVEDQVRAELARAQREQAQADAAQADQTERETIAQRVAKLEEKPPEPPVRRATRALGWGDGRR